MNILFLAIVLCVTEGQARANHGGQSNKVHKFPKARYDYVTGEDMIFFVIRTLENLQSLYEDYAWDDLYQYPGLSLQLPNKHDDGVQELHSSWNPFASKPYYRQELDRLQISSPEWSRRKEPPKSSVTVGPIVGALLPPRPSPPRPRPRRSAMSYRGDNEKPNSKGEV